MSNKIKIFKFGLNVHADKLAVIFILAGLLLLLPFTRSSSQTPESSRSVGIKFVGAHHFNERQIRQKLNLSESQSGGITRQQFDEKIAQLLQAYRDDGYLAAQVDSISWSKEPSAKNPLRVFIHEGEPFVVNRLLIFGNREFDLSQIQQWLRTEPEKIFRPSQLAEDVQQLVERYADRGYLLVQVEIQKLDCDFDNNRVDILIQITENRPVALRAFEIVGNQSTKPSVILRELRLPPGQLVSRARLQKIPEQLKQLPYIELTAPPLVRFTPDSQAVVTLTVREGNSSQLNGVLGYNPKQGREKGYVSGQIDLQFQNLLGTGRTFLAFWEKRGPVSQNLRLGYVEPWLFGLPVHGDFGFEQNVQDTSFIRRNWHLGLRLTILANVALALQVGQESVLPDSIGRVLYQLPRSSADHLFLSVSVDSRNHAWNPTQGLLYQTSVDFVRKKSQSLFIEGTAERRNFQRMSLDFEYIQPLFRRQVLMIGLHGRQVKIGGEQVSVDELFRLGGANDLRGYRDDQFLGSQVAWGSLEYRLILERDSRLSFFLDAGTIGRQTSTDDWQQLFRLGYGFGLRTKTDLGVIGFDYGLGQGDSFSQGKIHVRLINTF